MPKETQIRVRCTFDERAAIQAIAASQNKTTSDLIRGLIPNQGGPHNVQTNNYI
jgi:hypothetical protein